MSIRICECDICKNSFAEVSICPYCGARIDVTTDENTAWSVAYKTDNIMDATNYKALLEGADIPVQILSQIDTTRMFTFGDLSIVKIMVPKPYLLEALGIFESLKDDSNE